METAAPILSLKEVCKSFTSKQGKEAVVALLGPDEFFGEGCLIAQPLRLSTARAIVASDVLRIGKAQMIRVIHDERSFGEMFIAHLLIRSSRVEEDLVDPALNTVVRFQPMQKRKWFVE